MAPAAPAGGQPPHPRAGASPAGIFRNRFQCATGNVLAVHKTSFYSKYNKLELPQTEQISEQVLTLPLYPNMTKDEIEYLINSISEFFED